MNTREMVNIALQLAGLQEDTVDTEIGCEGADVHRVLAGIDMSDAVMLAAKALGWKVSSVTEGQLSGDALDVLARQLGRDLGMEVRMPPPERRDWLLGQIL